MHVFHKKKNKQFVVDLFNSESHDSLGVCSLPPTPSFCTLFPERGCFAINSFIIAPLSWFSQHKGEWVVSMVAYDKSKGLYVRKKVDWTRACAF